MNLKQAKELVRGRLSDKRYEHITEKSYLTSEKVSNPIHIHHPENKDLLNDLR